jgi:hypothetical protein
MTTEDIFRRILEALNTAGIPYMLTGSFAGAYHGIPRATQDIDLVIAPTASQLQHLVRLLPDTEYYISGEAALDALRRETQFNVIDFATGWKIDLIIRKSRIFSHTEFERRSAVDLFGLQVFIASAEDILLAKLEWVKAGESMRQLEDCANILRARREELDYTYIQRWVLHLGLAAQWEQTRRMAGERE